MTDEDARGRGTWVVLPTYDEADNIRPISAAILEALPEARLLVVDDGSPDGTGDIADTLAAADPRIQVLHRPAKQGLGRAYLAGFAIAVFTHAQLLQSDPVAGSVVARNEALDDNPELLNSDPYGEGWIADIEVADPAALDELLDAEGYRAVIAE